MKKITSLILAVLTIFLATACNTIGDSNTESTTPEEPDVPTPMTLSINGVDISNFKIVYSSHPWAEIYAKYPEIVKEDTEFDKQSAEHLAEKIKEHFGVELQVVKDTDSEKSDYEINIGNTNRYLKSGNVLMSLLTDKDYVIKEINNRLLIAGSTYGATWHAVDAFIEQVTGADTQNADIPKNYFYNGKADLLSVGFIGDSITNGSLGRDIPATVLENRSSIAPYTSVIQRMEWKDLLVYNYGHGGRTMMEDVYYDSDDDCRSYCQSPKFTEALKDAKDLDVVVIMLGTNDASSGSVNAAGGPISSNTFKNKFIDSCQYIVESLTLKNPELEVIIATSPVCFRPSQESDLQNYIRKYQKETAELLGLELIDVGKSTKANMTSADFPDSLHPSDTGYAILAQCIDELLMPILNEMIASDGTQ